MIPPVIDIDARNRAFELLKKVDSLVKSEEYGTAREEILRARGIDPRNMYAQAYLERVDLLLEQQKRNQEAAQSKLLAEEAAKVKAEQERQKMELEEEALRLAAEETRKQSILSVNHPEEIASYKLALYEAWTNGIPSRQQQEELNDLCNSLHITPKEHSGLERSVRRERYIQAFRELWSSEKDMAEGPSTITALRRRYQIDLEEFDAVEEELLNQLKRPAGGPLIVLIDDDQDMLNALSVILQEEGYAPRGFTTSDEAYQFLLHTTPEMILTDVNLETSTLGGFAFYERIQDLPRLTHVPFVFMSGLTDEVVIRVGKEMGADDYLPKPFDSQKLLSVVRGKIRRYSELRNIKAN